MDIKTWYPTIIVVSSVEHETIQPNVGMSASGATVVKSEMKVLPAI